MQPPPTQSQHLCAAHNNGATHHTEILSATITVLSQIHMEINSIKLQHTGPRQGPRISLMISSEMQIKFVFVIKD